MYDQPDVSQSKLSSSEGSPLPCSPAAVNPTDSLHSDPHQIATATTLASPTTLINLALRAHDPPRSGALNLIPCTAEQYLQLCDSIEDKYELVDGLLVWRDMPDRRHLDSQAIANHCILHAHAKGKIDVVVYIEPKSNFDNPSEMKMNTGLSSRQVPNFRIADVAIGDPLDDETRHDLSPNSQKNPFSIKRLPRVVIEITSEGNYSNDVHDKWNLYTKYNIPEYYIVDRQKDCVVRGYFCSGGGYVSGDCSNSHRVHPKEKGTQKYYCRKIFRGDEKIEGDYLGLLDITAKTLLHPPHLPQYLKELEDQRKRTEQEMKNELKFYELKCKERDEKVNHFQSVSRNLAKDLEETAKREEKERKRRKEAEKRTKKAEMDRDAVQANLIRLRQEFVDYAETLADPSHMKELIDDLDKQLKEE